MSWPLENCNTDLRQITGSLWKTHLLILYNNEQKHHILHFDYQFGNSLISDYFRANFLDKLRKFHLGKQHYLEGNL